MPDRIEWEPVGTGTLVPDAWAEKRAQESIEFLRAHRESEYMSHTAGNRVVIAVRVGKNIHIYDATPRRFALVRP